MSLASGNKKRDVEKAGLELFKEEKRQKPSPGPGALWKDLSSEEKQLFTRAATRASKFSKQAQSLMIDLEPLECVVCADTIVPPIRMCEASHVLCTACLSRIPGQACPQCRSPVNKRNTTLEKMVEKLVVPCANSLDGCCAKFLGASVAQSCLNAERHLASCPHSPLRFCPLQTAGIQECQHQNIRDLEHHLTSCHGFEHEAARRMSLTHPAGDFQSLNCDCWRFILTQGQKRLALILNRDPKISSEHISVNLFKLKPADPVSDVTLQIGDSTATGATCGAASLTLSFPTIPSPTADIGKGSVLIPFAMFQPAPTPEHPQEKALSIEISGDSLDSEEEVDEVSSDED